MSPEQLFSIKLCSNIFSEKRKLYLFNNIKISKISYIYVKMSTCQILIFKTIWIANFVKTYTLWNQCLQLFIYLKFIKHIFYVCIYLKSIKHIFYVCIYLKSIKHICYLCIYLKSMKRIWKLCIYLNTMK